MRLLRFIAYAGLLGESIAWLYLLGLIVRHGSVLGVEPAKLLAIAEVTLFISTATLALYLMVREAFDR